MSTGRSRISIGKEVKAFCSKCKTDMIHVVTKIVDGEIKKVFCKGCNSTHGYRTGETARKTLRKSTGGAATRRRRKPDWATLISDIDDEHIVDYDLSKDFSNVPAIRHKKFGVGVITNVVDKTKIEVVFQGETKLLAHNYS